MIPLTVGSLFSGIGGFELGLERTGGFKTVWQCEIDPFCQKILEKHWPDVKRFTDIKTMGLDEEIPYVDVICGGFPCQPVSCAGKRKGKEDARWLWPEFCRVVRCVRPEWVLVENVPGLLSADSGRLFAGILRDLSEGGYDAEWKTLRASDFGGDHERKRVFLVAHSTSIRLSLRQIFIGHHKKGSNETSFWSQGKTIRPAIGGSVCGRNWCFNADISCGMADGLPNRLDRLRALGNAIVPQCAQFMGQCLLDSIGVEA